jgi:GLPGLI family protein
MKKATTILAFFFLFLTNAQNLQGSIVYQYKRNMKDFKVDIKGEDPNLMKSIEESVKKSFEKNYILDFEGQKSLFYEEVKLDAPKQSAFSFSVGNAEKSFKDLENMLEIEEKEFFSKEFLVEGKLTKWDWQITQESKQIGDYMCVKATLIIPVTAEEIKAINDIKEQQKNSKFQFGEIPDPKDKEVIAWFTPEIPLGHGPREFWGLPGLVLELHKDKESFLATQIILNPKNKNQIKQPKKGKKVTKEEYQKIEKDKFDSMKDENGNVRFDMIFSE